MNEQLLDLDYCKEQQLTEACSFAYIGLWIQHFKTHDRLVIMPTRNPHIRRMELTLRGHITTLNTDKFLQEHILSEKEYAAWNAHQWEPWLFASLLTQEKVKKE